MEISTIIIGALAWLLAICLITIFVMASRPRYECICTYYEDREFCEDCD